MLKKDYSFTLFEATYKLRTGNEIEPGDYISFGLVNENGVLTKTGSLLADQPIVFNARIFCTHWNGLTMGSVYDDAIDPKEYEGNLISLLQNGCAFIKNNTKVRWTKAAHYRIEKPDYAERAVTEALVNALVHRDYIIRGTEIHIDIYDDRLEITSPGGMFSGEPIQYRNPNEIYSIRRNPTIADVFSRMHYMERRGSGLQKILKETAKLDGYTEAYKPTFLSTSDMFRVTLKNVNYRADAGTPHNQSFTPPQSLLYPPTIKIYPPHNRPSSPPTIEKHPPTIRKHPPTIK